ncbi:uncharacterized protein LOC106170614 [Lingula anatina]|uniref:Uncharacterized protein LOC106170614 n=1 Tax=Lingula anatina TaxID=7574 RepID=A0A1S3J6Z8_LINAN|nr:uncharacterized protein LOC106170614 [Lingula anatina]|eukprot:XP_013406026.1 uncharacterized protein LOC106170614 [Lingula anatina]
MIAILPVLISFVLSQLLGVLWYSQWLFGRVWARHAFPGKSYEDIGKNASSRTYIIAAIAHAVIAIVMCYILGHMQAPLLSKFLCLALLTAALPVPHHIFLGHSLERWAVDAGYDVAVITMATCVFTFFGI